MRNAFYDWWFPERFEKVANPFFEQFEGSFVFGGFVRGQLDPSKRVSDVDLAVRDEDYAKAQLKLTEMGCQRVYREEAPRWIPRETVGWETWTTVGSYSRFMCPQHVQVDLIDHKAFDVTLETMPSDIHFLVYDSRGLRSYDEERFPTDHLVERLRKKVFTPLRRDATGCEKLLKEGYKLD